MASAPTIEVEQQLLVRGARTVAGVDEVGRGALAGPVSVGVAVVDANALMHPVPQELRDSKVLSRNARERLIEPVSAWVTDWAIGHAEPSEIDEVGIVASLRLAWTRAYSQLAIKPDAVILDGKHNWIDQPRDDLFSAAESIDLSVTMIVKADALCASVSAASVLAKVARDHLMYEAHTTYPDYGFASNVGYGSAGHMQALRVNGATDFHRRSWNLPEHIQA